ncbi:MAG TPA: 2Fe-2S iron-sulfur cluster-binding protein, partial [Sphingomonas sp.]|nr:2Fe-2S iron-sulfur cluster-binding protein [Sphingomonas sp.]
MSRHALQARRGENIMLPPTGPGEPEPNGPVEIDLARREPIIAPGEATFPIRTIAGTAPGNPASGSRAVRFKVNGRDVNAHVEPRVTLLDCLRDHLHLTGTKKGCNEGACGTCTVLVDGR